ncbi:MAG: CcmD family protein [bacterium]
MQNFEYLFAAYSLIWIFISFYLFFIGNKQYKIIQKIEKIKDKD